MSELQRDRLARLAALLQTAPVNLLSRRDRLEVRARHVDEAAAVWAQLGIRAGERWLDLGTGGGLPGLVLAVLSPDAQFVLLDATRKKTDAVDGFVRDLGLDNVRTVAGRAERLAWERGCRESFHGVISRAVGSLVTVAELSRGFVRPDGRIVAIKGTDLEAEMAGVRAAQHLLGLTVDEPAAVPGAARASRLVTLRPQGPAPLGVPRADGVPRARPLAGHGGDEGRST